MADAAPRVRFAPSPTGYLHIGGVRTALFNWLWARKTGGSFVLRIEDTDQERSTAENKELILRELRWLAMDWDEGPEVGGDHGPYSQMERLDIYQTFVDELVAKGAAYRCSCSSERLAEVREKARAEQKPSYDGHCRDLTGDEVARRIEAGEPFTLRFRVPAGTTRFADLIRGDVEVAHTEIEDWVMVRAGGAPTYNFVCVVDDADMGITHVIRGEDHLTNTPKQLLLYEAFGFEKPQFAHLPLMLGSDKKKLSKRTGDTALQDYRDRGYPPEAVVNFLALQGWALDGETEVFSVETLVEAFDLKAVSKGGAVFDAEKFLWMAGEYVRCDSVERLAERCAPFVVAAGLASAEELDSRREWWHAMVAAEQERIRLYSELPARVAYLFVADDAVEFDPKAEKGARKHAAGVETLSDYAEWLAPLIAEGIDADGLRDQTKAWVSERGIKIPVLFQPLRCVLTGLPGGPDLFEIMALLGTEATLARLRAGGARLAQG